MSEERDLASDFEDWLNKVSDDGIGLSVYDLDMMETVILIRLRSVYTPTQLHARAHGILQYAENILQTPNGLVDGKGNPQPAMLVENFQGDENDLTDMLQANVTALSDDEIIEFFAGETGEEE